MKHNYERFCKDYENIENYEKAKADNFVGWDCHHRKGADIPREKLIALGMYLDRPAEELIFLTRSEHMMLHQKGKKCSKETKKKMSEAKKCEKNPMYGKHLSEEHKNKVAEAMKGHPISEESRKKMSKSRKGMRWFNNGEKCVRAKECPPGFVPGRLRK